MKRLFKYIRALIRWVLGGHKYRSQERINEIYNTICLPCENFEPEYNMCGLCWCHLNKRRDVLNKIALYTEECEIGRWKEETERREEGED